MKIWKKVLQLVLVLSIFCLVGILAAYFQAKMFIHNPSAQRDRIMKTPDDYRLAYEPVTLTTKDGCKIAAWYIPSRNRSAIIVVHGYKSNREAMLPIAAVLAGYGYGVMLVDLRAHGESGGKIITFGQYEVLDLEAAYQWLSARAEVSLERIGSLGVSLGGAVVILHAAQNPGIKAVAVDSAFTSLPDEVPMALAKTGLPSFLLTSTVQWFAEREMGIRADLISPLEVISRISPRPVLLMQGGDDRTVPPDSGHRLYEAAGEPKELWFEPKLGHTAFAQALPAQFEERVVKAFFGRHL